MRNSSTHLDSTQWIGQRLFDYACRRKALLIAATTLLIIAYVAHWLIPRYHASDIVAFIVPGDGPPIGSLRTTLHPDGALLIVPPSGFPTLRYNETTRHLTPVIWNDPTTWLAAEPSERLRLAPAIGQQGKVVGLWRSPDRRVAVALTARGWSRPEANLSLLWPLGGTIGGGYTGQHYVEFLSIPDFKPLGEPLRVSFTTATGFDGPVWSPDSRHVVFAFEQGRKLIIVPLLPGPWQP